MSLALAAALVGVLTAQAAQVPQERAFADVLTTYRSGQFDRAVAEVTSRTDAAFATSIDRWFTSVRTAKAEEQQQLSAALEQQLQVALLLDTEVAFSLADALLGGASPSSQRSVSVALTRVRRWHDALASFNRRSPFLRTWYLLWGSYVQARSATDAIAQNDLIGIAARAFPDDPEILLMAGSGREMTWWMAVDNPQRTTEGQPGARDDALREARDYFKKSIATGLGSLGESHLRLGRALIALQDYDAAAAELEPLCGRQDNVPFAYLANLFMGDLYERRGNLAAASTAYDAAIRLVPSGQSAQIAAAHLAHRTNARQQAADLVQRALSQPPTPVDPWSWYVRGAAWQLNARLDAARRVVTQ